MNRRFWSKLPLLFSARRHKRKPPCKHITSDSPAFQAYEFDDNEILSVYPEETFGSGRHIRSLYYPLTGLVPERMHTFRVFLSAEGGEAAVPAGGCIASISGQAMAGATKNWDGTLEFEEYFPAAGVRRTAWLRPAAERLAVSWPQEKTVSHTEAFPKVTTGFTGLVLPE